MADFVTLALTVAVIAFGVAVTIARSTHKAFQKLARRHDGTVRGGGLFLPPAAVFSHAGAWFCVELWSSGGKIKTFYTQIQVTGQLPDLRCEIYPEGTFHRIGELLGMHDIQIGSPNFDADFVIKGEPYGALRVSINEQVQASIYALLRFLMSNDLYISIDRNHLLVKIRRTIRSIRQLEDYVELVTLLYVNLLSAEAQGIHFVKAEPLELASQNAICQICGDTIRENVVYCRRCKTPHHPDCWEYYGACSTYGCQETRFEFPSRKSSAANR